MKTVCKKLLCLMLVAMMLVSAVPFAFAAEGDANVLWVELKDGNGNKLGSTQQHPVTVGQEFTSEEVKALAETLYPEFLNGDYEVVTAPAVTIADGTNGIVVIANLKATCEHTNTTTTNTATCGAAGVKTVVCDDCDEVLSTEDVAATGNHNMVDGKCTNCDYVAPTTEEKYTLVFVYLNANGVETRTTQVVENGDTVSLPTLPLVDGKDFIGWTDGDGNTITSATVWNIGESQTITANYETDTTEDGIVKLNVWAYYYVDGVYHHKVKLYTEQFESTKKNTMFTWLYSDGITQTQNYLAEQSGADGYQWANKIFYDYYDDGAVTEADMKSNANTSVYIKVYSKDEIESSVMLYVHTSKTSTVDRVIPMPGYTAGDYVSLSEVKTAVKTKYTGSNMTFSSLYTEEDWDDLLDGINSTGASSVKVETNGITKIHVIVKNATSTSSAADSSNPQTGDYITVAMTTMVLAAAALVSFVELKKRKMI